MRFLLICALFLSGCAGPKQPYSTDALAEQKQRMLAERRKQNEKDNQALRLALRQAYLSQHPELNEDIRKAILKEKLHVGMSMWDVIAAYSLWQYTSDARVSKYRETGVPPLWELAGRQQTKVGQDEEWVLQRQKDTQHLYFQKGALTSWKG